HTLFPTLRYTHRRGRHERTMELVSTRRFTVFGCSHRSAAEEGELVGANGGEKTNTCKRGDDSPAVAAPLAFEKDGETIDIPTMQLRELNNTNTSRFVGLMEKHGFVVLTETG
ncbi:unnamed protein product, partial [Ectocarpus sp. 8 AP-2014]